METKNKKLFVNSIDEPMEFMIIKGNMLQIKYNQLSTKIKEHGGVILDYNNKNKNCIILASKTYPAADENVYNTKYINDCISKNKLLILRHYRIKMTSENLNNFSRKEDLDFVRKAPLSKNSKVPKDDTSVKTDQKNDRSAEADLEEILRKFPFE